MSRIYVFDFGDELRLGCAAHVSDELHRIEQETGCRAKRVFSMEENKWINKNLVARIRRRIARETSGGVSFEEVRQYLIDSTNYKGLARDYDLM